MRASLTRRGYAVAGVVALAVAMGWLFGGRALNAVVMTGVALLAVGLVSATRTERPEVARRPPETGTAGETVRVKLDVDSRTPATATVADELGDGLEGDGAFETVASAETLQYDVRLTNRGVYTLGPIRVRTTDVFGLWKREFFYGDTDTLVVFPRTYPLYESAGLLEGYVGLTDEREQFDGVREYRQGDALRDINWKHSAKRQGDLVVTEYAGEGASRTVTVAVDPVGARVDSAAEAAGSVAMHLMDAGISVALVTPERQVPAGGGDAHRRRILTALARLERGPLPGGRGEHADVLIRAPADGSHVGIAVGGGMHRFGELVTRRPGSGGGPDAGEVAP